MKNPSAIIADLIRSHKYDAATMLADLVAEREDEA